MSEAADHPEWTVTTLSDLGRLHCGQSPPSEQVNFEGEGVPYISGPEQWDGAQLHLNKWTTAACRIAPEDSTFITVKGAGVGTLFPGTAGAIGRDIYAFEPSKQMNPRFVFRVLEYSIESVIARAHGDIPGLTKNDILDHQILIPGRKTQQAVVSKIDELFSRIDEGERALERVRKLVERYRQSVLKAAVTGELTREWREQHAGELESGEALLTRILEARRQAWEQSELAKMKAKGQDPINNAWKKKYKEPVTPNVSDLSELPTDWDWASLDALGDIVGGITVDQKRDTNGCEAVPYLRVANVQRGYLDLSHLKMIFASTSEIRQLTLEMGDILFNEGGDLDKLGRGWIWERQYPNCIHQNHVFRARLFVPGHWNRIISWYCNILGRKIFTELGKQTTNLASLSLSKLKQVAIPLMSAAEAEHIVNQVEALESGLGIEFQELSLTTALASGLRQSVLKSAFSGQLVPQDPTDEPASVLLERIAAERAVTPKRTVAKQTRAKKTKVKTKA